jgi:hypothetical protein
MSMRGVVHYVSVRGTSISTSMLAPSTLHVTVVHNFGLPNQNGVITCDNVLLHLRFDHADDRLVHVWAEEVAADASESYCCVS